MSWLDDIITTGSNLVSGIFGGNNIGGTLLRTVMTGMALNKVTKSINKSNDAITPVTTAVPIDAGVRIQTAADTEAKIPVLYGRAVFGGSLIDVRMTADNKTMYYAYVLCENTGTVMSTGAASVISFQNVYWNDQRIVFKADGITASYMTDRNGKVDKSVEDLVKVYCYRSGSSSQVFPTGFSGSPVTAYSVMPSWTSAWTLDSLAFAIVRVDYNKEKGITGVGNMKFDVENSLSLPGDVLRDLMTNTRYGAGIDLADIKTA